MANGKTVGQLRQPLVEKRYPGDPYYPPDKEFMKAAGDDTAKVLREEAQRKLDSKAYGESYRAAAKSTRRKKYRSGK